MCKWKTPYFHPATASRSTVESFPAVFFPAVSPERIIIRRKKKDISVSDSSTSRVSLRVGTEKKSMQVENAVLSPGDGVQTDVSDIHGG